MLLPAQYQWLAKEEGPKMLKAALVLFGTAEKKGSGSNPVILEWAKAVKVNYNDDATPWCGLFMAYVVHLTGRIPVALPLWARNWANWGVAAPIPMLGDILVFSREQGGHVGIYVGEDSNCYHVLGGNQGDAVSIVRIQKNRLIAARRPAYVSQPKNVRRVFLSSDGMISQNES